MLIVEGTDLVGKTTFCFKLIDELVKRGYPYTYQHLSRLPECWDYYHSYLDKYTEASVADRFHDSELAYSYGRREKSPLDTTTYDLLNSKLRSMGIFKVVLRCHSEEMLANRFKAREEEEMYRYSVVQTANNWFKATANSWRFDEIINLTEETPFPTDDHVKYIVDSYVCLKNKLRDIRCRRANIS